MQRPRLPCLTVSSLRKPRLRAREAVQPTRDLGELHDVPSTICDEVIFRVSTTATQPPLMSSIEPAPHEPTSPPVVARAEEGSHSSGSSSHGPLISLPEHGLDYGALQTMLRRNSPRSPKVATTQLHNDVGTAQRGAAGARQRRRPRLAHTRGSCDDFDPARPAATTPFTSANRPLTYRLTGACV